MTDRKQNDSDRAGHAPKPSKAGEAALDEALEDSFPASDPLPSAPRQADKTDRHADMTAAKGAQPRRNGERGRRG